MKIELLGQKYQSEIVAFEEMKSSKYESPMRELG